MRRLRGPSVATKLVFLIGSIVGALAITVFAVVPPRFERQLRESLRYDSVALCQMIASNVGASLVFEDARMAQELLYRHKVGPLHDEVAGKCVSQVMEGEVPDPGPAASAGPTRHGDPDIPHAAR